MSALGPSQTRLSRSLLKDKFQFCWNQEFLGHGFSVQHKVWGRLSPASPNNIRPAAAMPRWQKAKCLQGREGEHGREPNRSSEGHECLSAPSLLTPQRCSNPNRKSRTLPGLYARFISPPFSQFSFISPPPPNPFLRSPLSPQPRDTLSGAHCPSSLCASAPSRHRTPRDFCFEADRVCFQPQARHEDVQPLCPSLWNCPRVLRAKPGAVSWKEALRCPSSREISIFCCCKT